MQLHGEMVPAWAATTEISVHADLDGMGGGCRASRAERCREEVPVELTPAEMKNNRLVLARIAKNARKLTRDIRRNLARYALEDLEYFANKLRRDLARQVTVSPLQTQPSLCQRCQRYPVHRRKYCGVECRVAATVENRRRYHADRAAQKLLFLETL